MKKIILASASPRRKELLDLVGISFTVHPSNSSEEFNQDLSPGEIVEQLALKKAQEVAEYYDDGIVIGADTIVVNEERILGKPINEKDAFLMLKNLEGKEHQVFSGLAIVDAKSGKSLSASQMTKVFMGSLTDEEIESYIKTKEPLDKAGSYGIQGIGALFIKKIEGDYFNVVGLPLFLLTTLLKSFGLNIIKNNEHLKSKV